MLSFALKLITSNSKDDAKAMTDVVTLMETEWTGIKTLKNQKSENRQGKLQKTVPR
jgi:hypothetical protein